MALCHTSGILTFNEMARYIKKTDRDKPWARKALARDVSIIRQAHNIFLIYCEGENTEPEYFRSFPVNTETLVEAVGLGMSRTALVQRILQMAEEKKMLPGQRQHDPDRQIWAVFDHDDRGEGESKDFDEAVHLATANGLRVAYSNDAFELWFFLHDAYVDGQLNREHYFTHLSKAFGFNYREEGKKWEFSRSLYSIYLDRQPQAIRRAQQLLASHQHEPRPSRQNPCTKVHLLVLELNACLKR
jgi:hypothetical protein